MEAKRGRKIQHTSELQRNHISIVFHCIRWIHLKFGANKNKKTNITKSITRSVCYCFIFCWSRKINARNALESNKSICAKCIQNFEMRTALFRCCCCLVTVYVFVCCAASVCNVQNKPNEQVKETKTYEVREMEEEMCVIVWVNANMRCYFRLEALWRTKCNVCFCDFVCSSQW